MNPRTKKKMENINFRLKNFNQEARIITMTPSTVILNTGHCFVENDAKKFIRRIMNLKVEDWVKNIDLLLSGGISEDKIKHISFAIGGKACQKKHGEKIKLNLNNGQPWNKGTKGQRIGMHSPRSIEVKQKISEKNKGSRNGRYGYIFSDEEKLEKSMHMKELILNGKFTPKSNNRNTHWESILDGVPYRSSWEALYKYINQNATYEKLRLSYNYSGRSKIYIVDFIDYVSKAVIEVKPKELCVGIKFAAKLDALTEWAKRHSYEVLIIDQKWFQKQTVKLDYSRFDEKTAYKIRKFYEIEKKN